MQFRLAALLLVCAPLAACASSHLTVEQAARNAPRVESVRLEYGESTADVTQDAVNYLNERMRTAFYEGDGANAFRPGDELTIRYRYIGYERGSRLARYALGGLAGGEATMVVEAEFLSPNGQRLALVRATGEVGAGFAGGSHNSAIDEAVDEIHDYAKRHFRDPQAVIAATPRAADRVPANETCEERGRRLSPGVPTVARDIEARCRRERGETR